MKKNREMNMTGQLTSRHVLIQICHSFNGLAERLFVCLHFLLSVTPMIANDLLEQSDSTRLQRYKFFAGLSAEKLYEKATLLEREGNEDSALTYYSVLYDCLNTNSDKSCIQLCAQGLLNAGIINYRKFNYAEAMKCFLRGLDVVEGGEFSNIQAELYKHIGNIYSQFGDYAWSISLYEKALTLSRKSHEEDATQKILYNLSLVSLLSDKQKQAEDYYQKMKAVPCRTVIKDFDAAILQGMLQEASKQYDAAIAAYQKALGIAQKNLAVSEIGSARSCMSRANIKKGRYADALVMLQANERDATAHHQNDLLASTYQELSDLYRQMGNRERHLDYLSKYLNLSNEIFNRNSFNSLKNAQFLYEQDKSNAQIKSLAKEKAEQESQLKKQFLAISAIIGVVIVLAGFLIVIYRQKQRLAKAYDNIYEHNLSIINKERQYRHRLAESEKKMTELKAALQHEQEVEQLPTSDIVTQAMDNEQVLMRIRHIMEQEEEYLQCDFSIDKLALLIGSTSRIVSQIINEEYGQNFRSFLNEYRIREAMSRLSDVQHYGHYTIKAIAESVGYKSQSNFIAVFTKIAGIKPSLYKNFAKERANGKRVVEEEGGNDT